MMPIIAGAQSLHVAEPGQEPQLCHTPHEDVRLLDPTLVTPNGIPASAAARKRHFTSAAARRGRFFNPGHVYTIYQYQHLVDLSSYELHMVKKFDLARHLDGQPLRFVVRDAASGHPIINMQIWHQRLLAAAQRAEAAAAAATSEDR